MRSKARRCTHQQTRRPPSSSAGDGNDSAAEEQAAAGSRRADRSMSGVMRTRSIGAPASITRRIGHVHMAMAGVRSTKPPSSSRSWTRSTTPVPVGDPSMQPSPMLWPRRSMPSGHVSCSDCATDRPLICETATTSSSGWHRRSVRENSHALCRGPPASLPRIFYADRRRVSC
jgi:hypothetical protein